jgi:phosphoacetylglucosamine mutase
VATENGYYKKLSKAYLHLRSLTGSAKPTEIKLDGANGVGGPKVKELSNYMKGQLPLVVYNDGVVEKLNEQCGADYVKLEQCEPQGMTITPGDKCVTFDGDADRVMYFFLDEEKKFHLLDGDRIATLIAGYLKEKVDQTGVVLDKGLGMVQTAYANGSSTKYAQTELKVPVAFAKTGVKYVHHRAEQFDIGIYFEANGHGTVIFSDEAMHKIREAAKNNVVGSEQNKAATELVSMIDLINQAVGDAMSDMLVVEAVLSSRGWDLQTWYSCYTDLSSRQLKVKVKDRAVLKTSETETEALEPEGLQEGINKVVAKYTNARSFARPSGTEDVVRVYAEGDSREAADALAVEVAQLVFDFAGGIGERPQ